MTESKEKPKEISEKNVNSSKSTQMSSSLKGTAAANDLVRKLTANLARGSPAQQLILGSVSGWTSGFLLMKVGRPAAFVVGGGIIISQAVYYAGYGNMHWDKIKDQAKQATQKIDAKYKHTEWLVKAKRYSRSNPCFAAGFIGGFLIGVVS